MYLDVVIKSDILFDTYRGFTFGQLKKFLKETHSTGDVYIRQTPSKRYRTTFRILPNISTEFYRCPRISPEDDSFLNALFEKSEVYNG